MRYFLFTYNIEHNFQRSKEIEVFGARHDGTGISTKVHNLRKRDIILIRNSLSSSFSNFFGYCIVTGRVFNQLNRFSFSPFKDFLWDDELRNCNVIYPDRVTVDFDNVPKLHLGNITLTKLNELGILNSKGYPIIGGNAWAKKFMGNFIEESEEMKKFNNLLV